MDWLSRVRSEPTSAPAGYQAPPVLYSPITPGRAARTRDPNAPNYRYQVNQKCIYERYLPGGSYVGAHIQRLQSGYYDSNVIHEDLIENVRFVAVNFVFHPSRRDYRFKSATISLGIHHTSDPNSTTFDKVRTSVGLDRQTDHDHATQTDTASHALVRSRDHLPDRRPKPKATSCRPKFLRHAPHLLFGSVSPESLDWNFNVAGSLGVSQGPVSASLKPSYGKSSSYKVYEMMRIQGSMRTLRAWYDHQYDVEDGEIVWTLEENTLQNSGLPREFTFVLLLTKGSGGFEPSDDVTLGIDINPQVSGPLGGTYSNLVMSLPSFQPVRNDTVNLDEEIGQVFEPSYEGRGFNFANLASNFDDFVWMPGTTYSSTENAIERDVLGASAPAPQPEQQSKQRQLPAPQEKQHQNQQHQNQINSRPSKDNALNLRIILENSRGSPVPITNGNQVNNILPYLQLKQPSRNPSPLPPSIAGSRKSKRSIVITSRAPPPNEQGNRGIRNSHTDSYSQSRRMSGGSTSSKAHLRQVSHTHSLRKTRSRSGLDKEYIRSESPMETRGMNHQTPIFHDAKTEMSPEPMSRGDRGLEASPVTGVEEDGYMHETENMTPLYGDEHELKYGDEQPIESLEGQQSENQQFSPPQEREEDLSASRVGRFPSLSQGYIHDERARDGDIPEVVESTRELPELPVSSSPRTSQSVEREQSEQYEPSAEEVPLPESARELSLPSSPPLHDKSLPALPEESDSEMEPQYLPLPEPRDRELEQLTPSSAQPAAPESPLLAPPEPDTALDLADPSASDFREPDLEPETTRDLSTPPLPEPQHELDPDPSTPPWHQHSSSMSPPSAPPTASTSKTQPSNATPRFSRPLNPSIDSTSRSARQSLDNPSENWNDTPPEWASPGTSGSNTPIRNRSLRTRKATARALAMQDQSFTKTQTAARGSGAEEYYRTPKATVPARGHSLHISAGPQARLATARSSGPQSAGPSVDVRTGRYQYPAVPPTSAAKHVSVSPIRKGHQQQPSASIRSSEQVVRKPVPRTYNYTHSLLQDGLLAKEGDRSSGSSAEQQQQYQPDLATAAAKSAYTREQKRQLIEMERDSINKTAQQQGHVPSPPAITARRDGQVDPKLTLASALALGPSINTVETPTKRQSDHEEMDSPTIGRGDPLPKPRRKDSSKDTPPAVPVRTTSSMTRHRRKSSSTRDPTSFLAKAQRYMREAGYGAWGGGEDESGGDASDRFTALGSLNDSPAANIVRPPYVLRSGSASGNSPGSPSNKLQKKRTSQGPASTALGEDDGGWAGGYKLRQQRQEEIRLRQLENQLSLGGRTGQDDDVLQSEIQSADEKELEARLQLRRDEQERASSSTNKPTQVDVSQYVIQNDGAEGFIVQDRGSNLIIQDKEDGEDEAAPPYHVSPQAKPQKGHVTAENSTGYLTPQYQAERAAQAQRAEQVEQKEGEEEEQEEPRPYSWQSAESQDTFASERKGRNWREMVGYASSNMI